MPDADSFTAEVTATSLLGDVTFEGDQGLWEIVWTLNRRFPNEPLGRKIELAREAVRLLGTKIELWRGAWPEGRTDPLTDAEVANSRGRRSCLVRPGAGVDSDLGPITRTNLSADSECVSDGRGTTDVTSSDLPWSQFTVRRDISQVCAQGADLRKRPTSNPQGALRTAS